jgi:2-(1,2-epoxy-1,2-dihydrophenyl)acetyl-CoA isomerase
MSDIEVELRGEVGVVALNRPPHNFMDAQLIADLVRALHGLQGRVGAAVLCANGRNFCAGADVTKRGSSSHADDGRHLYDHAFDLYAQPLPLVAAVQGKTVGGGVGVAITADLRVGTPETSFRVNFAEIGIHPGFGLSATLPELVGAGPARDMFLTSRPVKGEEALRLGLLDRLVDEDPLAAAVEIAQQIARTPAGAAESVRATLRRRILAELPAVMAHERAEQDRLVANLGAADAG